MACYRNSRLGVHEESADSGFLFQGSIASVLMHRLSSSNILKTSRNRRGLPTTPSQGRCTPEPGQAYIINKTVTLPIKWFFSRWCHHFRIKWESVAQEIPGEKSSQQISSSLHALALHRYELHPLTCQFSIPTTPRHARVSTMTNKCMLSAR